MFLLILDFGERKVHVFASASIIRLSLYDRFMLVLISVELLYVCFHVIASLFVLLDAQIEILHVGLDFVREKAIVHFWEGGHRGPLRDVILRLVLVLEEHHLGTGPVLRVLSFQFKASHVVVPAFWAVVIEPRCASQTWLDIAFPQVVKLASVI